jgi:hypothetical protein
MKNGLCMTKIGMNALLKHVGPAVCVLLLVAAATGCDNVGNDFLSQPPSLSYTQDSVFASQANAEKLLVDMYATLPYGLSSWDFRHGHRGTYGRRGTLVALTDLAADNRTSSVSTNWYTGNISAGMAPWPRKYRFIRGPHWDAFYQGNTLIENIDRVPDMTQAERESMKAQARVIMAIQYINMFRNIGGVVWVGEAVKPDADFTRPRLTVTASVDSITALIDKAVPHLPTELSNVQTQKGRTTKAAAYGMKTELLAFAASPLFNSDEPYLQGRAAEQKLVWTGGYKPELWERARDAAESAVEVIENSSYYGLVKPSEEDSAAYRAAYREGYFDRGSGEILVSSRLQYEINDGRQNYWYFINGFGWAKYDGPTQNFASMFPDENGVPIDESDVFDEDRRYLNRDPRFYETLTTNVSEWGQRGAEMWIGGRERPKANFGTAWAGYKLRKFVFDRRVSQRPSQEQWPMLRVPEVYFYYAEALAETGNMTRAYEYINKMRSRVGLKNVQKTMEDPQSMEAFRSVLLRERTRELGFENVRWYDLIRHKKQDTFTKTLHGMNVYREEPGDFRFEKFDIDPRAWAEDWSPKWYLSPIPQEEINKEYGVIQNPGW